jgi:hypothetical protein
VCDPNNVETVALLKKDTKPCPKCGTMIFKISGCSQMWCPDCHTAFDWVTMRIEVGRIHNPHFYEFQRSGRAATNREHGDIPCGGLPTIHEILKAIGYKAHTVYRNVGASRFLALPARDDNPKHDAIARIHRLVLHIQHWAIGQEHEVNNQPLRVKYLLHEISEDAMKVILQKNEKAREKLRDRNNLLRMFCDVTGDLLRQLVLRVVSVDEFLESSENLRAYVRTAFTSIHKRYTCSTDWISDEWDLVRNSYKPVAVE